MPKCSSCQQRTPFICAIHGSLLGEDSCPYCDVCEHGKNRCQVCDECNSVVDMSWRLPPLSDAEVASLTAWVSRDLSSPRRSPLTKRLRYYRDDSTPLVTLLLRDYAQLRAKAR